LTDYSPILSTRISSPNSAFSFSRYVATLPSPSLTILELNKAPSLLKELTLKKEEEERKEKELKLKQTNDFLIQKGLSFAATNKHYQAIDLFEKAISNDSNYCPALYFKADSLFQLLNYNE
jgi:tetratricopeptide (TPR) repeat protein